MDKITRGQFLALSRSSQGAYLRRFGLEPPPVPDPRSIEVILNGIDGAWTADEMRELRREITELEVDLISLELRWCKAVEDDLFELLRLFEQCGTLEH